jgi:hypothetical protein
MMQTFSRRTFHNRDRRVARSAIGLAAAVALSGAGPAHAQTVAIEPALRLPLGLELKARVHQGRVAVSVSRGERSRRSSTVSSTRRRRPSTRRPPARTRRAPAPVITQTPTDQGIPETADGACIAELGRAGVPFVGAGPVRGIATPIQVTGPIGGVRLISRARRPALMDCELARALADAAPTLRDLGVTGLAFSGTYDYRNVRGSGNLSGHAFGLAIDVHQIETAAGLIDVEREYPHDRDRWPSYGRGVHSVGSCLGAPATEPGRLLRTLTCQLASRDTFRLIITPDDNYDHRNHLHLEAYPGRSQELMSARASSFFRGRRSPR